MLSNKDLGKLAFKCHNIKNYLIKQHGINKVDEYILSYLRPTKAIGLCLYNDVDAQSYAIQKYGKDFVNGCLALVDEKCIRTAEVDRRLQIRNNHNKKIGLKRIEKIYG